MKAAIEKLANSNEQIRILAKRLEVASAFVEDDYNKMKENSLKVKQVL